MRPSASCGGQDHESRCGEVTIERQGFPNSPFRHDLEADRIGEREVLVVIPLQPVCDGTFNSTRPSENHCIQVEMRLFYLHV